MSGQVLLVNMPFCALDSPSLGLSLLKAELSRVGVACDLRYLNLLFSDIIGVKQYDRLSALPSRTLVGDWLFAEALFGTDSGRDHDYCERVLTNALLEEVRMGDRDVLIQDLSRIRGQVAGFFEACKAGIPWDRYLLVGFTTVFSQTVASLGLAKWIKDTYPDKIIVFGGAHCEGTMGLALHRLFPFVDIVCSGEGDIVIPALVECLLTGRSVTHLPGIISRSGDRSVCAAQHTPIVTDLDALPYPDYADFYVQLHSSEAGTVLQPSVWVETSRGCWWGQKSQCTFCGLNGENLRYRSKSPHRAIEEIVYLHDTHGCRINAVDNILDLRYFRSLLPEIHIHRPDLRMFYEVKANLSREQVQLLKSSGVESIEAGIESLSTPILALIRKGSTFLHNVQTLKWCRQYGIAVVWNFLYGFPGEEPDEYAQMAQRIPSLLHLQPPHFVVPVVLDRFSPYFRSADSYGLHNIRPAIAYSCVFPFSSEDLYELAYDFEFDLKGGRDLGYVEPLLDALAVWQARSQSDNLWAIGTASSLCLWDLRSSARHHLIILKGGQRKVYEFCDRVRSRKAILSHLQDQEHGGRLSASELDAFLHEMVELRLMVRDDDRVLSLAVSLNAGAKSAALQDDAIFATEEG